MANVGSYGVGMIPELVAIECVKNSALDQRENGFWDLLNEVTNKHNIQYIMTAESHAFTDGMRVYLNKSRDWSQVVKKPEDLKGLKMRSSPGALTAHLETWGAVAVPMSPPDTYTAVERGVVDGLQFPIDGIFFRVAIPEVIDFYVDPGFSRGGLGYYMNLDIWNSFSPQVQKLMLDAAVDVETKWIPLWAESKAKAIPQTEEFGVKRIQFSPEDGKRFKDSFYEGAWELIVKDSPEYGSRLKALAGLD